MPEGACRLPVPEWGARFEARESPPRVPRGNQKNVASAGESLTERLRFCALRPEGVRWLGAGRPSASRECGELSRLKPREGNLVGAGSIVHTRLSCDPPRAELAEWRCRPLARIER